MTSFSLRVVFAALVLTSNGVTAPVAASDLTQPVAPRTPTVTTNPSTAAAIRQRENELISLERRRADLNQALASRELQSERARPAATRNDPRERVTPPPSSVNPAGQGRANVAALDSQIASVKNEIAALRNQQAAVSMAPTVTLPSTATPNAVVAAEVALPVEKRTYVVGATADARLASARAVAQRSGARVEVVDLSSVVSKHLGETEKNLQATFAAAKRANVVLFFDEADALFGKRSEVKDSHDRYANIEPDRLLALLESAPVRVILGLGESADPDASSALKRWHRATPAGSPVLPK